MKTLTLFSTALLLSLTALPAQSTSEPKTAADTAVAIKDGAPYLVRDDQAFRLDTAQIPEGQMLNAEGQLVQLPANVSGFEGSAAASTGASASASADPAQTGITIRNGTTYLVRAGQATRIDSAALGDNQMMTLDGRQVPIPATIDLGTAGTLTPGKVTPGTVTPGKVEGGSVRGADVKGADVKGADVRGGNVTGGSVTGGNVRGGDVRGGDVQGGNVTGGTVRGGDVRGGDVRGGNTSR